MCRICIKQYIVCFFKARTIFYTFIRINFIRIKLQIYAATGRLIDFIDALQITDLKQNTHFI